MDTATLAIIFFFTLFVLILPALGANSAFKKNRRKLGIAIIATSILGIGWILAIVALVQNTLREKEIITPCPKCGNSEISSLIVVIDATGNKTQIEKGKGAGLIGGTLLLFLGVFLGWLGIGAFSFNAGVSPIIILAMAFSSLWSGIRSLWVYFKFHNAMMAIEYRCNNCGCIWYEQEGKIKIDKEKLSAWSDEESQIAMTQKQVALAQKEEAKLADYAKRTQQFESLNAETETAQLISPDRLNTIISLLEHGDERAIRPLMEAMEANPHSRPSLIMRGFGLIRLRIGEKAIDPLIEVFQTSNDLEIKGYVILQLEDIGSPRAVEPLERALGDVPLNSTLHKRMEKALKKLKSKQPTNQRS